MKWEREDDNGFSGPSYRRDDQAFMMHFSPHPESETQYDPHWHVIGTGLELDAAEGGGAHVGDILGTPDAPPFAEADRLIAQWARVVRERLDAAMAHDGA